MRRSREQDNTIPIDMTPMIDVVFQLIIFFMLVVDLSQQELEDIVLPRASQCQKDDPASAEKFRKIVNVKQDGTIVVKKDNYTLDALRNDLYRWRNSGLFKNDPDGFCSKPILIRTDRGTEMKHCQKIMQICGEEQLKIWKIELACAQDSPGLNPMEDPTVRPEIPEGGQ